MSRRNRIVRGAIIVVVSFVLAAPAATFAARLPQERRPRISTWELAWSWLANAVSPGTHGTRVLTSRWEAEGGGIDPNGQKAPSTVPSTPFILRSVGGGQ